jgi:Zn-dependent protease with chaperone function
MSVEHVAAVICAWLISYFVHSTLLLGAAWVVTCKIPSRFDRLSELVWRLALVLPVATALAQPFLRFSARDVGGAGLEYAPPAMAVSAVPSSLWLLVAAVWIAVAVIGLTQLWLLHRSLGRALADRAVLSGSRRTSIATIVGASTRVSVGDGLSVPLALTSEICLPRWVLQRMDQDEFRAVVAHEMAHVRRRDALSRRTAAILSRVFFFQPLNWLASARLRELSECICDEEAIEMTRSTLPLASALERVASRRLRRPAHLTLVPAMDAGPSFTVRRVMRILSTSQLPQRVGPGARLALVLATSVVGFVTAPRLSLPEIAFQRYTINAEDPVGRFSLTVDKGRVIGGTVGGRALHPEQVIQQGSSLRIVDPAGDFSLHLTPNGGISWNARKRGS